MDIARLLRLEEDLEAVVERDEAGARLDVVVSGRAFWASRTSVQRWIREGRARVDGEVECRPGRTLAAGQRVEVRAPKTPRDLGAEIDDLLRLPLVHEDEGWLVIGKPPGVPSHPGGGVIKRTLLTAMAVRLAGRHDPGGPWLPHRLDRETSGLMVVALRKAVQTRFVDAFERHAIRRVYDARVRGHIGPAGTELVLDAPLRLVERKPMRVAVRPDGVPALTRVRVIGSGAETTDVEIEPETGRQHQIRVHLEHAGHAILGDPLYDALAEPGQRLHLHARELVLPAAVAGRPSPVRCVSRRLSYDADRDSRP